MVKSNSGDGVNVPIYEVVADYIAQSKDSGGELVKLLEKIDVKLIDKKEGILITQAVPEDDEGNPIIHIAVFTNKETDFPLETEELYIKWVRDFVEELEQ